MPQWEIFTYGNGEFLFAILNGVVLIVGDDNFTTLMRLAVTFGLFWVVFKVALYRGPAEWTYPLWFVLIYGALFVPRTEVLITDRLDNNQTRVVANVPLALGAFAGASSMIGDWFTRAVEYSMSQPDDLKYHRNGLIFGSTLIEAASQYQITDGRVAANMSEFIRQCVYYDVLLRRYTWTELLEAPETWEFIRTNTASNSRAFTYIYPDRTQQILLCRDGANNELWADWLIETVRAANLYGKRQYPRLAMADASARLFADLPVSYDYLAGVSRNSGDLLRQNMLANAFRRAFGNAASATDASAAAQDFAMAQAESQQFSIYAQMGRLAAKLLPLLRNIYEGLLLGMFPFIFLIFMLPFGAKTLFGYIKNIVWLQLWAPLYAILNLIMVLLGQADSTAAAAQVGGQALSLATHSGLAAVNAETAILAGYLGISVPLFAYALVSGGQMALTQLAVQASAAAQAAATQASSSTSTGNINLATLGAYNTGMMKNDTSPVTHHGTGSFTRLDGATEQWSADGTVAVQKLAQNLGASLDVGSAVRYAQSTTLQKLDAAERSSAQSYGESLAGAYSASLAMSRNTGWGMNRSDGWSEQDSADYRTMVQNMRQISDQLMEKEGFTRDEADRITAQALAQASFGLSGKVSFAGRSVAMGEHSETDKISQGLETARAMVDQTVVQRGAEALRRHATSGEYRSAESGSNELGANLRAALDDMTRSERQWRSARSQQVAATENSEKLQSADMATRANLTYDFLQDVYRSGYDPRQLTLTGGEERLGNIMSLWAAKTQVGGIDGVTAIHQAVGETHPSYGLMGSADSLASRVEHLTQPDQRRDAVDEAEASANAAVNDRDSAQAEYDRYEDRVLNRPLRNGDVYSGANANGIEAGDLGRLPLSAPEASRTFKDEVNQYVGDTGPVRRTIARESLAAVEEAQQRENTVKAGIAEGRRETEGFIPTFLKDKNGKSEQ